MENEQQVVTPNTLKKSNFLTNLLSLVLLLSIASAAYFAYQVQVLSKEVAQLKNGNLPITNNSQLVTNPDPTLGWKTYIDPEGIFSFKYPQGWNTYVGNIHSTTSPKNTVVIKSSQSSFDINMIYQQNNLTTPEETLNNFVKNTIGENTVEIEKSNSEVVRGYITQIGPEDSQVRITIEVISKNQNTLIATTVLQEDKIEIFNQILSTFEFTE